MAEGNSRQLRVLHIVSTGGIAPAMHATLFVPLATRMPKDRVKVQVVSLAPGCVRAAMLRQSGVPVHDVALSRQRFSLGGFKELMRVVQAFRPDVLQAWGHTAQIAAVKVRKRCSWKPRLVWSVADTVPLKSKAGLVDRQKLKYAARFASAADRIVYTSEAGAAHHRRVGFPDGAHECVSPGVDATRFKTDAAVRTKVREQLQIPREAIVIGMIAPFQPEYDHATLLKAIGELIKTNPNLYVLLAGHGVQRGNAPLMAMLGSGTLANRTQLLGEWSDLSSLLNACDIVCSSALTDEARMMLAMGMLCGVPCVATGMGAQGELIGQFGVGVEPGSPAAFMRGITKILELPTDRRAHMEQSARKHALKNYVYVRSLQKYLQLYGELVGREVLAAEVTSSSVPVSSVLATSVPPSPTPVSAVAPIASEPASAPPAVVPEPAPVMREEKPSRAKLPEIVDPDSLEAPVAADAEVLPKWRIEQEQQRAKAEAMLSGASSDGDVLQLFEMEIAKPGIKSVTPMGERARGFVEDFEELLSPEALTAPTPTPAPVRAESTVAKIEPEESLRPAPASSAKEPAPLVVAETNASCDLTEAAHDVDTCPALPVLAMVADQPSTHEPKQESLFDFDLLPPDNKEAVSG